MNLAALMYIEKSHALSSDSTQRVRKFEMSDQSLLLYLWGYGLHPIS